MLALTQIKDHDAHLPVEVDAATLNQLIRRADTYLCGACLRREPITGGRQYFYGCALRWRPPADLDESRFALMPVKGLPRRSSYTRLSSYRLRKMQPRYGAVV